MEAFKLGSRHASLQLMRSPQPSCMQGQIIIILSIGDSLYDNVRMLVAREHAAATSGIIDHASATAMA
jgi:hypothetical protein